MCEEKRNDDRPAEDGTLNSGGPDAVPQEAIYLQRLHVDQPQEDDVKGSRESDPSIVVRDDKADHMAKERADGQRGQSTHVGGTNTLHPDVSRTLSALGTKAAKCPEHRFRALARLIDRQMLREAFHRLRRKA
ncbi:hypothetical protein, partial [Haloferula sp. A504]|uniref:hypothetical protein n=1 Tax=Haloferula sp. A504 TaxID=3373601 RepID=UPI0031C675CC|nr:hypothetical protein [Verrucomicrobiaceae bacterium E54]